MSTTDDGGLRPLFFKKLPMVEWTAIESGIVGGVPDANGVYKGSEFWTEFKATRTKTIKFRPLQPAWIARHTRAGGKVWVIIRVRSTLVIDGIDRLLIVDGQHIEALVEVGTKIDPRLVATYEGGPGKWNWQHILEKVSGRPL